MGVSEVPSSGPQQAPKMTVDTKTGIITIDGKPFRVVEIQGNEKRTVFNSDQVERIHGILSKDPAVAKELQQTVQKGGANLAIALNTLGAGKAAFQKDVQAFQSEVSEQFRLRDELVQRFKAGGYALTDIREALDSIFGEASLFAKRKFFGEWSGRTLSQLLQEPGNEALYEALQDIRKMSDERYDLEKIDVVTKKKSGSKEKAQCLRCITMFAIDHAKRNVRAVKGSKGDYVQHFVRGEGDIKELRPDKMWSMERGRPSEIEKEDSFKALSATAKERKEISQVYSTNLGAVVVGNKGAAPVVRSGRSDTTERLLENVLFSAMTQAQMSDPRGFNPEKTEFTHMITSYMGPSAMMVLAKDPEHVYWRSIQQTIDKWPPEGYKVKLQFPDGEKEVVLKKPIMMSQRLNAHLTKEWGEVKSFRLNFLPNQQLLFHCFPGLKGITDYRSRKSTEITDPTTLGTPSDPFFNDKEYKDHQTKVAGFFQEQLKEKPDNKELKALFAVLFYRMPPTDAAGWKRFIEHAHEYPQKEERLHAVDMELFRNYIADKKGVSIAKQCKGGSDRTPVGVALAEAQHRYHSETGEDFWPVTGQLVVGSDEHKKLVLFKKFFREAVIEHGVEVAIETKGYSGLNMGGSLWMNDNPVLYKYLYMPEDIGVLDGKPTKSDVAKLTYADLARKGEDQYKGTLISKISFFKKEQHSVKKGLQKLLKNREAVKAARDELSYFLENRLGVKMPLNAILDDRFTLQCHIRKLNLNKNQLKTLQERVMSEQRKQSKEPKDMLALYALRMIMDPAQRWHEVMDRQAGRSEVKPRAKTQVELMQEQGYERSA